jgi:hypothetical protein
MFCAAVAFLFSTLFCSPCFRAATVKQRYQTAVDASDQPLEGTKEVALPGQPRDLWTLLSLEMGYRCDWLSVVAVRSGPYSRGQRVLLVVIVSLVLFFLSAVCYDTLLPKGRCVEHLTKHSCLAETRLLPIMHGCEWLPPRRQCIAAVLPWDDYLTVVAVAIVVALVSIPLNHAIIRVLGPCLFAPLMSRALQEVLRAKGSHRRGHKGRRIAEHQSSGSSSSEDDDEEDDSPRAIKVATAKVTSAVADVAVQGPSELAAQHHLDDWQVARFLRLLKLQRQVDLETSRIAQTAQASWRELHDYIRAMDVSRDQLRVRIEKRGLLDPDAMPRLMKQMASLTTASESLKAYLLDFQKKWNLDEDGRPRPPTCLERLRGERFYTRLRRRVLDEISLANRMERLAGGLTQESREKLLLECQRLDFMTPSQRAIYLRYMLDDNSDVQYQRLLDSPVSWPVRAAGMLLAVALVLGMVAYLIRFAGRHSMSTTCGWLASLVIALLYEPCFNMPISVLYFGDLVPRAIQAALEKGQDKECSAPFQFRRFIPIGPGAR